MMTDTTHAPGELLDRILTASERVYRVVRRTPLVRSRQLSERYGAEIYLKLEHTQPYIHAYKGRGAANFFYAQSTRPAELVTASGGNHALAVARVAYLEQVSAVIFVSRHLPAFRSWLIRQVGRRWVRIEQVGEVFDDALQAARAYARQSGSLMVPPFDDLDVIAGQGTLGLEVAQQLATLGVTPDLALCQVGGGGLLAGFGTVMKAAYPNIRLVGVELTEASALTESLAAGSRCRVTPPPQPLASTMAVSQIGRLPWLYARALVDQMVLVSGPAVARAMIDTAAWRVRSVGPPEPAGAAGMAALEQLDVRGQTVICLITGGNFDRRDWRYIHWLAHQLA
jgi:threonine dehydratase